MLRKPSISIPIHILLRCFTIVALRFIQFPQHLGHSQRPCLINFAPIILFAIIAQSLRFTHSLNHFIQRFLTHRPISCSSIFIPIFVFSTIRYLGFLFSMSFLSFLPDL